MRSSIDTDDALLAQYASLRVALCDEYDFLANALRAVQTDLATLAELVAHTRRDRDEQLSRIADAERNRLAPLKSSLDTLRAEHGLPRLPSAQEETERANTAYLSARLAQASQSSSQKQTRAKTTKKRGVRKQTETKSKAAKRTKKDDDNDFKPYS
eukprot:TRINITY_DN1099_c0_g2_i1.p1 TRINITY_DN1099_c0_g2~~TRINITY_DN1099_c0_g2_i1.p1  ORF type:complete len:156 (-),score=8.21 TRINITY_DN1099_c0_g2_i1:99-566(-)